MSYLLAFWSGEPGEYINSLVTRAGRLRQSCDAPCFTPGLETSSPCLHLLPSLLRPIGSGSNGDKKANRRSFCLANPSECLELLRSIQARWHTACTVSCSSPVSCGDETPCVSANTNTSPNPSLENASGGYIPASSKEIKSSDAEAGSCREQAIPPSCLPSQLGDNEVAGGGRSGNIVSPFATQKKEDSRGEGRGGGGSVLRLVPVVKKEEIGSEVGRDVCRPSGEVQEEAVLNASESPAKVGEVILRKALWRQ